LGRRLSYWSLGIVVVIGGVIGGIYLYAQLKFDNIPKVAVPSEIPRISGQPFNVLIIGSDSRAGLTGNEAAQTGGSSVQGQRSDVVKIAHIDPGKGTIQMVSIPRDTLVTLLANQSLYTNYNRINVNYANGPNLLVKTIEANFGIPINHVVQVSFGGLINATEALGGVYLNFPYPAKDAYSGLNIKHTGCQLVDGFQALAVARSRHYEYFQNGQWVYDGTSDYGRIDRQNTFIRALIQSAKGKYNPLTLNSFLSDLPQGITLDNEWSLDELIGLAFKFHSLNPAELATYTLPTISAGDISPYGDVLVEQQPEGQQLLVNIFGSQLEKPTNPPPNAQLQVIPPPDVTASTTPIISTKTTTTTTKAKANATTKATTKVATTTTTVPGVTVPYFDPTNCTP